MKYILFCCWALTTNFMVFGQEVPLSKLMSLHSAEISEISDYLISNGWELSSMSIKDDVDESIYSNRTTKLIFWLYKDTKGKNITSVTYHEVSVYDHTVEKFNAKIPSKKIGDKVFMIYDIYDPVLYSKIKKQISENGLIKVKDEYENNEISSVYKSKKLKFTFRTIADAIYYKYSIGIGEII